MSVSKAWELLPASDFTDRSSWRHLGGDRYSALRARLLIVCTNEKQSRLGQVIEARNVPAKATLTFKRRREQVISRTDTISEAIRFTTTSRVCDKLAARITSELAAKVPGFSGKLQSDILAESEHELTQAMESTLNTTTSHFFQVVEETENVITLNGDDVTRLAELRRRFWPKRWDVFLHSYEYLELSYRTSWFWWQVRETIKRTQSGALGWPLFSLRFYEPQSDFDVFYESVPDEIDSPDAVEILALASTMPSAGPPGAEDLESMAKLAFPVTSEERAAAAHRRKKRRPAAKKAAKKSAKKKAGPRKAVKKKAAKKKAAKKKGAKKKGAKKKAAKRKAAKKR